MSSQPPASAIPAKRRRTDVDDASPGTPDTSTAIRYEKLWFEDGSVVLHVQNHLYRVHRTMLSKTFETFKDMFAVPQPLDQEMIEGCPVVHLHDDDAMDWQYTLEALYDTLFFGRLGSLKCPLTTVLVPLPGILRLCTKYRALAIRKTCIFILGNHFPVDSHRANYRSLKVHQHESAARTIAMARDTNAVTLLPYAFLCVADQNRGTHNMIYDSPLLTAEDKATALNGLYTLIRVQREHMFPFVDKFVPPPACRRHCRPEDCFEWYHRNVDRLIWFAFQWKDDEVLFKQASEELCPACHKMVVETFNEGRQKVWEMLPSIFRLGKDWDELRRIQNYDSDP